MLTSVRNGEAPRHLVIVSGHHRCAARIKVGEAKQEAPMFWSIIYEDVEEANLVGKSINTCVVPGIPDYYHVQFKFFLSEERIM